MRIPPLVFAFAALIPACGTSPTTQTVVPAPPLPAPVASNAAPIPKPPESASLPVATPPPPPPSPIASLLAAIPPPPIIPPRTCPKVPNAATNVAIPKGQHAFIVTVSDYLSLAPIADVRVNIFHGDVCTRNGGCKPSHPHPPDQLKMTGKTDASGRVEFQIPDLEYDVFIPEDPVPGYLPFSTTYNMGKRACHDLSREKRSANGRAIVFDGFFVPDRMLTIHTQDDAIAGAMQLEELVPWIRDHQDAAMTVRGGGSSWEVGFGYNTQFKRLVLVNAFDGSAAMLIRWN